MTCFCSDPVCRKYGCRQWAAINPPLDHNGYYKPIQKTNNEPWICPRCSKVNAPWTSFCCKEK